MPCGEGPVRAAGGADSPTMHEFAEEVARLCAEGPEPALVLSVGVPAGPRERLALPWPVPPEYDAGLALVLADAVVDHWRGRGPAWAWVARPGIPDVHDADLLW